MTPRQQALINALFDGRFAVVVAIVQAMTPRERHNTIRAVRTHVRLFPRLQRHSQPRPRLLR